MNNRSRKLVASVLAASMILTMAPAAVSAQETEAPAVTMTAGDISGHWAQVPMQEFIDKGWLAGISENVYAPDLQLTRAQYAALINRVLGFKDADQDMSAFTDVNDGDWFYETMAAAAKKGYLRGTSQTTMGPNDPVTREQAMVILARLLNLAGGQASGLDAFADKDQVSDWAVPEVSAMVGKGYIFGDAAGLRPQDVMTRAEGVAMLSRLKDALTDANKGKGQNNTNPGKVINGGGGGGGSHRGGGSSGGGGGSANSGNKGGTTTPDGPKQSQEIVEKAVVSDLGYAKYVTAKFHNGYNLDNTTLSIDGVDVTSHFTPVTDDGSIVKWELEYLNPGALEARSGDITQKITLSDQYDGASKPLGVDDTDAGYFIGHGPMAIWDYYLPNYDAEGNLRVEPAKTTFATGSEQARTGKPAYYAPAVETENGTGDDVVIMFNARSEAEKAWFDGIADQAGSVQLVRYDETMEVLNKNLSFVKKDHVEHGPGNYINEILIPQGQANMTANGRYYVRVKSAKGAQMIPIHLVAKTAPTLELAGNGGAITSGDNVHFKVENMATGITTPSYGAELTYHGDSLANEGTATSLTMIDDFYQISADLLVLYNAEDADGNDRNKIKQPGWYTLTVHSNGYKDMSCDFKVTGNGTAVAPASAPQTKGVTVRMDAVSSATMGGGTGGASGDGGGQKVSADVKFDADLLANAKILNQMGIVNQAAQDIEDRWNSLAGWDSVSASDTTMGGYDYQKYVSAVSKEEAKGEYLTFAEYSERNKDLEKATLPHAVKSVLEDNLLGDIQNAGAWVGKRAPAMTMVDAENQPVDKLVKGAYAVYFLFEGDQDYAQALDQGTLLINNTYPELKAGQGFSLEQAQTDGKTYYRIKVPADKLTLGQENVLVFDAPGYKNAAVAVKYSYDMEEDVKASLDKTAYNRTDDIIISMAGSKDGKVYADQFGQSGSMTLVKPNGSTTTIYRKGVQSDEGYFEVEKDADGKATGRIIIHDGAGRIFEANGTYSLRLENAAAGYNAVTTDAFTVEGELKAAPTENVSVQKTVEGNQTYYDIIFGNGSAVSSYKISTEGVAVNGKDLDQNTSWFGMDRGTYDWKETDGRGTYALRINAAPDKNGESVFEADSQNTVVIRAQGYEPVTVVIGADGSLQSVTPKHQAEEPGRDPGKDKDPADGQDPSDPENPSNPRQDQGGKDTDPQYQDADLKAAPSQAPRVTKEGYTFNLTFQDQDMDWLKAVKGLSVNGTDYSLASSYPDSKEYGKYTASPVLTLNAYTSLKSGDNTVLVKADGYQDLTLHIERVVDPYGGADTFKAEIVKDGASEKGGQDKSDPDPQDQPSGPAAPEKAPNANDNYNGGCSLSFGKYIYEDWMNAITGLVVNGTEYSEITSGKIAEGQYRKYATTGYLDFGGLKDGENSVVIKAGGSNDLTLTITKSMTAWGDTTYEAQIVK